MDKFISFGIDTSNYRCSAAAVGKSFAHNRELLPVKNGNLGLRQNDAVFLQTKMLPVVIKNLLQNNNISFNNLKSVSASYAPTDENGSYMPCFLVGLSVGEILSAGLNLPFYKFSHQCGHIAAAAFSANKLSILKQKFIAFHVSGGTTECLIVEPSQNVIKCTKFAGTLDLNAGQVIDRIGLKFNFTFPCGDKLENYLGSNFTYIKTKPAFKNNNFCLSGLENKCNDYLTKDKNYAISYLFSYIADSLCMLAKKAIKTYGELPILFSGGVMANNIIKNLLLSKLGNCIFALPELSGDNAVGTAILGAIKNGEDVWNLQY